MIESAKIKISSCHLFIWNSTRKIYDGNSNRLISNERINKFYSKIKKQTNKCRLNCFFRWNQSFPINQWMDTNQNSQLDILIDQGSVQLGNLEQSSITEFFLFDWQKKQNRSIRLLSIQERLAVVQKFICV